MEDIDPEYFKNLSWILGNDINSLGLNFSFSFFKFIFINSISIDVDNFGETKTIDLIPNGRNITVTEANKK